MHLAVGRNPSGENLQVFATSLFKGGMSAARFNTYLNGGKGTA